MKGEKNRWDPNGENLHPPPTCYARSALHRGYRIHPRRVVRRARGGSKTRYLTLQRVRFEPLTSHRGGGSSYRSTTRSLVEKGRSQRLKSAEAIDKHHDKNAIAADN
ncbi:hypothetical protein LXL04_006376 [Taraxacum kok-saghyz]